MSTENKNIQPSSSPKNPPFWKASLIKVLRGTIGVLEITAVKLETESPPDSEEKPTFSLIQQGWSGILGKIRLILPAKFSAKLSNTALTGIISGLAVMIFLIVANVSDRKPPQIAIVPPVISTTNSETAETPSETTSSPPAEIPQPEETPSSPPPEIPQPEETTSLPPPEIPQPEETTSSPPAEIPQPEELETILTPLTPEETLIAAIQNQIAEISNSTFSGIIESIQANFLDSNLTVKINHSWYELEKKQQDKLADQILQRSQQLNFTHLEITDLQSKLLARSPVIGTEMIILKRK